ncbi:putative ubiquitin-like-specific protease 2A [Phytophthora citrophthora]|uniref:Ubiquitin-like-specific protease 2A n=1 Tax=Phytophthora citrophthora TaxID=4793 RepID=A0AAD9GS65_9STRA|nr:putative ubiquitin-like-specific protease 2A [Phytophthora citrophthora]
MDERRQPSRFGAARRHTPQEQRVGGSSTRAYHHTNTLAFSSVASDRGRPIHHNASWADDNLESFNFDKDEHKSERSQGPDKYTSGARIKASGQSISAPGSSITSSSCASSPFGVHDGVLSKGFVPPKKQGDFLAGITSMTKRNTILNRGTAATRKTMAYTTPAGGGLEAASAPTASKDIAKPQTSTSGWLERKPFPKPRTPLLMSREKRMKLNNNERKSPAPVTSHYALRDRSKPSLFGHEPTSTRPFSLRKPGTRLGKRKNTEGSASKPIALDSDTDSESEVQAHSTSSKGIVEEVLDDTRRNGSSKSQEEKQPAEDWEGIALSCMARINSCDVLIGIFQCNADLLFQGDRMCMRNIRGKYEKWPFKDSYIFSFDQLQDIWRYYVSKEDEIVEIDADEKDQIERLLDEAPYLAFKLPFPEETDQTAVQTFYDPTGSDVSKGYMIFRPTDEATGGDLVGVEEVFRSHADIHKMYDVAKPVGKGRRNALTYVVVDRDGREQAKRHLEALAKDPFSYEASRRSRRRQSNGADAESSSESEDDADGNITVLTYPLPPCTSDIVTIIRRDVSRLKPRRYLNDNIIDYYFKRMMLDTLGDNELVQEKVLFLSSHFYSRLRAGKGPTARERMDAGYKNVSTWLARSNVFNRSIIFIPINKDLHWSLAVILNPGIAGSDANDEEAASCIAVLDPLGSYHRKAAIIRNLRAFLRMQWENSQNNGEDEYATDRVLTMNVKAPQQENSYDCGVYVLKFAEVILKNCLELGLLSQSNGVVSKEITDENLEALITPDAFSGKDIAATRKLIREFIESDTSEYQLRKKEEKVKKAQASKNQQQE